MLQVASELPGVYRAQRAVLSHLSRASVVDSLEELCGRAPHLFADSLDANLRRYTFTGPSGGGDVIRVGIFAGLHGDEPEGVHALIRFLKALSAQPELAQGYRLLAYPICNPTGFEDGTRHSRSGKDLNREFWRGSREPEVRVLEAELQRNALHGIISLHTDDTSNGFYGYAHGAVFTRNLVEPALTAAEAYLPINREPLIDGFPAVNGIIRHAFPGILRAAAKTRPRPFEVILETPKAAPAYLKEAALISALSAVLSRYRELISFAANL